MNIQETRQVNNALSNRALVIRGLKSKIFSADFMAVDSKPLYAILVAGVLMSIPAIVLIGIFAINGYDAVKATTSIMSPIRFFKETCKR